MNHAQRAARALRELAEIIATAAERDGLTVPASLELRIDLGATRDWPGRAARLLAEARAALEAHRPESEPWRPGRVYCFQCGGSDCRHAAPDQPTEVFVGYQPTGKPGWRSFVDVCVERQVPDLGSLFQDDAVVAFQDEAGPLAEELLPGFGRDEAVFRVRGQVVLGLVSGPFVQGDARRAVTIQAVETRRPGAPPALRLNVIGLDEEAIAEAAVSDHPRGRAAGLRRALGQARRQMGSLGRRAALVECHPDPDFDLDAGVERTLRRLRGDLTRILSPERRRTQHAQARHVQAERPTGNAWDDARGATDEQLFVDARRQTIIVVGRRNRAHVFTREGRQVTSLRLAPGELGRKTARGRWQRLPPAEAEAFRARVAEWDR